MQSGDFEHLVKNATLKNPLAVDEGYHSSYLLLISEKLTCHLQRLRFLSYMCYYNCLVGA